MIKYTLNIMDYDPDTFSVTEKEEIIYLSLSDNIYEYINNNIARKNCRYAPIFDGMHGNTMVDRALTLCELILRADGREEYTFREIVIKNVEDEYNKKKFFVQKTGRKIIGIFTDDDFIKSFNNTLASNNKHLFYEVTLRDIRIVEAIQMVENFCMFIKL